MKSMNMKNMKNMKNMRKDSTTKDMNSLLKTLVRVHAYEKPMNYVKPFVDQERKEGVGSGTLVDPQALGIPHASNKYLYILTCAHVIDQADQVSIVLPLKGSEKLPATVLAFVPREYYDLAVIALPNFHGEHNAFVSTLPLGSSTDLEPGEKLVALGFPMGQTGLKVSDGVFAGLEHYLQHTVSISPGNSGGPLINTAGQLIGINNAGIVHVAASNIGYAVPIELYGITAPRFFSKPVGPPSPDRVERQPQFGFMLQPTTQAHLEQVAGPQATGKSGVYIYNVVSGSPADVAGLQSGDFLGAIEQVPIDFHGEIKVRWSAQKVPIHTVLQRLSDPSQTYTFTVFSAQQLQWRTVHMSPQMLNLYASLIRYSPYEPVEFLDIQGFIVMPMMHNHMKYPETVKALLELPLNEKFEPHILITNVVPGSTADLSKTLKAGDRVTHVNHVPVRTLHEVRHALRQKGVNGLTTSKGKTTVL
jgi:S1-C subfamily serine protease